MAHGLALPRAKQPAAAPSPSASTSAPVANENEAIKHFADGNLQELINQAKGAAPGTSNAASPAASTAANGEDGALKAKGIATPTLQCVRRDRPAVDARRNMVATVDLGTRLDLKSIALHARNAEYNPKVRLVCVCGRA